MKKVVAFLFVVMAALSAKAQIYAGGSLGFWGSDDNNTFLIAPEVGYNLNSKWSFGGMLLFEHAKVSNTKVTGFALAPYARYTFFESKIVDIFIDGGIGFSTTHVENADDNQNGFEFGFRPGLEIKATKHLSFLTKFGFLGYRDDYLNYQNGGGFSFSGDNLSFGLYYTF